MTSTIDTPRSARGGNAVRSAEEAAELREVARRIGQVVRRFRGARRCLDVARAAGISKSTFYRVERGDGLDVLTLRKLCVWMGPASAELVVILAVPMAGDEAAPAAEMFPGGAT